MRMLKSLTVGTVASLCLGGLVFILAPKTALVNAYLVPGVVIGGSLTRVIPTRLVYWIAPDGGPEAFLAVALTCAVIFWSLVFGVSYRYARRR